jgi:hypothetical protein
LTLTVCGSKQAWYRQYNIHLEFNLLVLFTNQILFFSFYCFCSKSTSKIRNKHIKWTHHCYTFNRMGLGFCPLQLWFQHLHSGGPQWTSTHQLHHEGWMVTGQDSVFSWVPVP